MDMAYIGVLFLVMIIQFITLKIGGSLLPMVLGMFGIAFTAASLSYSADIPFSPYPQLLLGIVSTICCLKAAMDIRSGGL